MVVKIGVEDLCKPASLTQSLGAAYVIDSEIAVKVSVKIVGGNVELHVAGDATPKEVLKHLAPEAGLILVLDEAQHLSNLTSPMDIKSLATSTLNVIHNGEVGRPVILLAAGLGTVELALNSLGISRYEDHCRVRLGSLDHESTCAVIRDLIVHEGGVAKPPSGWVESIAEHTHGWPHHIISYAGAAADHLADIERLPTKDDLEIVLAQGRVNQVEYYQERAHGISRAKRQLLAQVFANLPVGGTVGEEDIMFAILEKYSANEADKLFKKVLHQGILDERVDGDYGIPIPSMQRWLVDIYARGKAMDSADMHGKKALFAKPEHIESDQKKDSMPIKKKGRGGRYSQE